MSSSYVPDLYGRQQRVVSREYKKRLEASENAETDFENKLWRVFYELKPLEITIGSDPSIEWKDFPYRPELLAVFENFIVIAEARYTPSTPYLLEGLSKLEEAKKTLGSFVSQEFPGKKMMLLFAIKDKQQLSQPVLQHAHKANARIVDERGLDYFLKLSKESGIGTYHQFFSKVAPSFLALKDQDVLAIKVKEGRRTKYIFSINPHELLERAFVSHREIDSPDEAIKGYQRMIKKARLKGIADYINEYGGFPSPIVVSIKDERFDPISYKHSKKHDGIEFGTLHLSNKPATIYVVDGQHRLYGFTRVDRSDSHVINVIAYKGLRGNEEGSMFVDINLKQTKVPPQLLWELYPDILSEGDDEYHKAIISRVAEKLAGSPKLKGKIAHISLGTKGNIAFPTLCSEIERSGFITKNGAGIIAGIVGNKWDNQSARLSTILEAFFDVLISADKNYYDVNRRFFLHNTGIVPLIRISAKICKQLQSEKSGVLKGSKSKISEAFENYLNILYTYYGRKTPDELAKLRKARVGGSGFNDTEDEMDDVIRKVYSSFPTRSKRVPKVLRDAVGAFVTDVAAVNRRCSENSMQWIFRDFDADHVRKKLEKTAKDTRALQQFVIHVHQELIESSGSVQQNPLNNLLGVQNLYEVNAVERLSLLRNKCAHRNVKTTPEKRAAALGFLRELANSPSLINFDDLDGDQCLSTQISLLDHMRKDFLSIILQRLG